MPVNAENINYMCGHWEGHTFLGVKRAPKFVGGYYFDEDYHAALYLLNEPSSEVYGEDDKGEGKDIAEGKLYVLVAHGSDNWSEIKRFKTKEEAFELFRSEEDLVLDGTWRFYNS